MNDQQTLVWTQSAGGCLENLTARCSRPDSVRTWGGEDMENPPTVSTPGINMSTLDIKQWLMTWKHLPNLTLNRVKHLQEKAKMSLTHGKDTCRHLSLTTIILNSSYDFCFLLWFTHHDNDLQYKRAMPKWSPTIVQPWMRSCCSQHVASAASPCLINLSSLSLQLVWWPEARSCPQRNENKPKFSKWKENKNVFLECV